VTNVNNNNNADGDEDERSSRSREASLARLASLTEQTTALDQGRRRLSVRCAHFGSLKNCYYI